MDGLRSEYENGNPVFVQQIDWLVDQGLIGIRRARGDGEQLFHDIRTSVLTIYFRRLLLQM